jgi:hypothetical protein
MIAAEDWRRLDERIDLLSGEIAALARQDAGCEPVVSVPGVGPIIRALWWPRSAPYFGLFNHNLTVFLGARPLIRGLLA